MNSRILNIAWTVWGNYDRINLNLFEESSFLFDGAVLGMFYKTFNMPDVESFLNLYFKSKSNFRELLIISKLVMFNATYEELFSTRRGCLDLLKDYMDNHIESLKRLSKKTLVEDLKISYFECIFKNVSPKLSFISYDLLMDIISFNSNSTYELLEFLKGIFYKYFHVSNSFKKSKELKDFLSNVKKRESSFKYEKTDIVNLNPENSDLFFVESAEFTSSDYENLKVVMDKTSFGKSNKDLYPTIKKQFGENILTKSEEEFLEKEFSTNIHSGINYFFTRGEFKDKNSYYAKLNDDAREKNLKFFKDNELKFNRAIINLSNVIKNSLLRESEDYTVKSFSGDLCSSEVWKIDKFNNPKIFYKNFKDDMGDLSVDVLLDSSASQFERQEEIATEGYIISEALTKLNIKTRVLGFNNFFNYLIIRKYRDYNDSKNKNLEIFSYRASGSNRDGLAIKLVANEILKNSQKRKILIVLSDGKPNDEINLGIVGGRDLKAKDYTGDIAIYDTYNSVLNSRLNGIDVLGVFSGNEEDLDTEKKIYSSDFAYITNINRFHEIVGIFLKQITKKLY